MAFHLALEDVRDRSAASGSAAAAWRVDLGPAHARPSPRRRLLPARQRCAARFLARAPAVVQPLASARPGVSSMAAEASPASASSACQRRAGIRRCPASCRRRKRAGLAPAAPGADRVAAFSSAAQPLGRSQAVLGRRRAPPAACRAPVRAPARCDTLSPKNSAGDFRQLVRLVEDHRVAGRQQLGHAFVAQHHVGEEQMVIDHHHVGRQRLAPRLHDEAVLVVRAVLAQAVLARRGGLRPDRRSSPARRRSSALSPVLRGLGEARDACGCAASSSRSRKRPSASARSRW